MEAMSDYIDRPLADSLLHARRKTVILEGARAVGKTMMMRKRLVPAGFRYETLADENTYALAKSDLQGWLGGLTLPVVIDEAQRIAELPLAIKEIVDALTATGPQVVLTGSAIISRDGLDGSNPLARRVQRFTMSPLTQREMHGVPRSLVDDLWDAEPNMDFNQAITRAELFDLMAAGGFPEYSAEYAEYEDWERERLVLDDIRTVLGDTILPGEKLDAAIAQNVLGRLLSTPGGILNSSALADQLSLDRRTVDRYVGVFMRRFLVTALPNLRTAPNRQTFSRSKIHPVDTSLSIQTLLSKGRDPRKNPVDFGNTLESFVVNQVVPSVQWSKTHPDCFYWRETGSNAKEVDLVMRSRGKLVGVEVKSSSKVDREDFKGLAELSTHEGFYRGFLVYTGSRILRWRDDLWALPVTALWQPEAFVESGGGSSGEEPDRGKAVEEGSGEN